MSPLKLLRFLPVLLLLLGCRLVSEAAQLPSVAPTDGPVQEGTAQATTTSPEATEPAAGRTPEVAATPAPALTPAPAGALRRTVQRLVNDPDWPPVGLSAERQEAWKSFAAGQAGLPATELVALQAFVERWELLHRLAEQRVPADSPSPLWSVLELPASESEAPRPVLAAGDGQGRYFVPARDRKGVPQALLLAPALPELTQRLSADGEQVEYLNAKGELLLRVDGRLFANGDALDELMIELMDEHGADRAYRAARLLPRYQVNLPGIPTSFYLLENLTYNQLLLLLSTLQVYDRPGFTGLKEFLFLPGDQAPYLITRQPHPSAAAMAYRLGGEPRRGVMLIFTRNVFRNKYETAGSLAHEAAHIWQGRGVSCEHLAERLRDEVGNGKIASDFYNWTPDQLFTAVQSGEIGAYHLSLWVAAKFNLSDYMRFYREIITQSSVNDRRLLNCAP